jgi:hypothetical protein
VNAEKRHAFIKMISRHDALAAKEGMELHKPADLQLRVCIGLSLSRARACQTLPIMYWAFMRVSELVG